MNPDFLAQLMAALGQRQQPPQIAPVDATAVNNRPRFPAQPTIGPVTPGNRPLPEATVQSRYQPRYDKAMGVLSDLIPVLGELRGVQQGHRMAQAGSPIMGALSAAASGVPLGGRVARGLEGEAAPPVANSVRHLLGDFEGREGRASIVVDGHLYVAPLGTPNLHPYAVQEAVKDGWGNGSGKPWVSELEWRPRNAPPDPRPTVVYGFVGDDGQFIRQFQRHAKPGETFPSFRP